MHRRQPDRCGPLVGPRWRLSRVLAVAFAAIPFVFGGLRALQTRTDFRYLVTALASLAAAVTIFRSALPLAAGLHHRHRSGYWL